MIMQEFLRILMQMASNPVSAFTMLLILFISVIWAVHWLTKKFTRIDMTRQNFKQSLEVLTESVREVKTEIVNLSAKMDDRFEKLENDMNDRFDKVDKRFVRLETEMNDRFDKMEAKMDGRIDRLEAKTDEHFERVEMRIERVETTLAATREDVASLKAIAKVAMRTGVPVRHLSQDLVEMEMVE